MENKKLRELSESEKRDREFLIGLGKKYIYPQRKEEWERCVDIRIRDIYEGMDVNWAIQVMMKLDKDDENSLEEAHKLLNSQEHSGASYMISLAIVRDFAKRGPEFARKVYKQEFGGFPIAKKDIEKREEHLLKIERENKIFEEEIRELKNKNLGEEK